MATIQRQLLSVGEISLRLGVPYARVRRFLRRPRDYVVTINRARGVAEEDLARVLADLKAEGLLRPVGPDPA
jgi:hypothetical protein